MVVYTITRVLFRFVYISSIQYLWTLSSPPKSKPTG